MSKTPNAYGDPLLVAAAVEHYRRQGEIAAGLLDLTAALAAAQASSYAELGEPPQPEADPPALPPAAWLEASIQRTLAAASKHSPAGAGGVNRLLAHLHTLDIESIVNAAVVGEALSGASEASGLPPATVLFLLRAAVGPFFAWRSAADPALAGSNAFPARADCPACGGRPLMGRHAEPEGRRFLRCSLCGYEWASPRMACANCAESNPAKLEAFFIAGDEGHRVYVCHSCRRYLKVADERLLGRAVYLPLEDIVTMRLDELARQRGFAPVGDGQEPEKLPGATAIH